jgi:hypothetical protein
LRFGTVLPYVALLLALAVTPHIIAWATAPAGKAFLGALGNTADFSVYLSAMRQGAAGSWLFHCSFSPEPLQPTQQYLLYILTGKLLNVGSQSPIFWFHALRVVAGVLAVVCVTLWVRQLLPGRARWQLTAWQLIVFGSGGGWLVTLLYNALSSAPANSRIAPDLLVPEWSFFASLFTSPHFALGLGLEVLFFISVIEVTRPKSVRRWVLGGTLAAAGLGQVYAYNIPLIMLVASIYLLAFAFQERRIPWREWGRGALMLTPTLWYLFYYGLWVRRDPFWNLTHVSQNVIPPPSLVGLVAGCGLIGLLAMPGAWRWHRKGKNLLVPIWALTHLLALYLPVTFSGRLALGVFVPLGTLAAYGLEEVVLPQLKMTRFFTLFARLTPTPYDSLRRVVVILAAASTIMIVSNTVKTTFMEPRDLPTYVPTGELQAAEWLAENADEQTVILANFPMGGYLPSVVSGKVFAGQPFLTINEADKLKMVQQFWAESTPPEWREAFVREWGITHIYYGRYEQAIEEGHVQPPGEIVYQAGGVTVYQTGMR